MKPSRPIRSLLIYTAVIFLGGAVLAPWVYWAAGPIQSALHDHVSPFHRVFSRTLLGLALICIWPLLRSLDIRSWRDVGIIKPAGQWQRLAFGFAFGFVSLLCVVLISLGVHHWQINTNETGSEIARSLVGAAASAIVVAILEELLFRGTIFGALRKTWDWRAALLLSSLIYAILHFIGRTDAPGPVTWHTGFEYLPLMFRDVANPDVFIPAFFSLILIGVMLGLAYQRTGNLYCSIGMHGGWIFWVKAYGLIAPVAEMPNRFWGSPKLIDGWLAFTVLVAAMFVLPRLLPTNRGETRT